MLIAWSIGGILVIGISFLETPILQSYFSFGHNSFFFSWPKIPFAHIKLLVEKRTLLRVQRKVLQPSIV